MQARLPPPAASKNSFWLNSCQLKRPGMGVNAVACNFKFELGEV